MKLKKGIKTALIMQREPLVFFKGKLIVNEDGTQWREISVREAHECTHNETVCNSCLSDLEVDHFVLVTCDGTIEYATQRWSTDASPHSS